MRSYVCNSHDFSLQLAMRETSLLIRKRESPIGGILKFTNRVFLRCGGHIVSDKPCGKGLLPQLTASLYFIYYFSPT